MSAEQAPLPNGNRPARTAAEVPGFSVIRTIMPGGTVRMALAGELDIATVEIADDGLRDARHGGRDVVLDLSALTFIDAAGLGAIVAADASARRAGRRLVVYPGSARCVRRLFEITGAGRLLDLVAGPPAGAAQHNGTRPRTT